MKRLVIAAMLALVPAVALASPVWYIENPKNDHCENSRQVAKAMGIPAMVSPVTMRLWAIEHLRHYDGTTHSQTLHPIDTGIGGTVSTWDVDISGDDTQYIYYSDINSCRRFYQNARKQGMTVAPDGRWIFHKPKITKAAANAANQELLRMYERTIRYQIFTVWNENLAKALPCTVEIHFNHQGQIIGQPKVVYSGGNPQFDYAVIDAVEKALPLSPPLIPYRLYKDIDLQLRARDFNNG